MLKRRHNGGGTGLDKTRYFALLSRNISEKNKVSLGFENRQKAGPG